MHSLKIANIWLKAEVEGRLSKAKEDIVSSLPWEISSCFLSFYFGFGFPAGSFTGPFPHVLLNRAIRGDKRTLTRGLWTMCSLLRRKEKGVVERDKLSPQPHSTVQ